ncbi:cytochrome c family protein [Sphingomonas sp. LaA6.9]|uniref:c-type cytochrome n=1 Tax=Sphingomonas sp. LaA6.9 TaxID=2919914 RepID=UPI001F4F49E2|nr:cytochrome c family protein [Sphingomonas sp. LaA6.9]MCJ8156276.1 cytochrome c family protein [Sphingomonas sp. LaA6.9]
MDDRFNTIAGWVLAAGIVALGGSIASGMYFKGHAPEKPGYEVADADPAAGGAAGAAAVDIATLLPTADAAKGAEVFKKCTACHTINQGGANGIGPNLWGALGKPHGHVAGFAYSDALKGVAGNWDFAGMDKWLASPRKYAPGTKMTFAGLSKPEDRANLIVYLNSQGSNLPLPAAGAAPAAADTAAAPAANAAAPAENAAAPAAH